ncbi:TRAP transporter fused permease subunit [Halovenus sp. WSH3]|uniref:TRAP transporter fused permease subunit n=1 Tax=Halovenus carboxidivorans TaxID=2692199 RepID=A0A6B0TAM0_9EURY|nr:TRAP transporter fused permease subunit [Halovenus carboxidivorans]MXR51930.1 TRAP transporter fused permease subunit [Halovenus carboxidivorans]
MSIRSRRWPARLVWTFDRATAVLAAVFTLFTLYYAFYNLTNLSLFGISFVGVVPDPLQFPERAKYVIIFVGVGLAVYYFDYARTRLTERYGLRDSEETASDEESDDDEETSLLEDLGVDLSVDTSALDPVRSAYARIDPYLAIVLGLAAVFAAYHVFTSFGRLTTSANLLGYRSIDHTIGLLLIILVTDATRRAFGWIIASVGILALVYMHQAVGPALPGLLGHSGDNWLGIIEEVALGVYSGVFDATIVGIGSTWVAVFIMFAGIAKAFGLLEFVREVGTELGGTLRTGVVQIAVISSMVMGSITGSAAANAATTGSFTIPMIKDQGIRDDYAAAIEGVASAGGQMLPPVMGVAAFLMADIVSDTTYLGVVQAGTIPAALFYLSVFVGIHFTILKHGWTTSDLSSFDWSVLKKGASFAPPLAVLLYTLVFAGYTPMTAGLYTIVALFVTMIARNLFQRAYNASSTDGENRYEVGSIARQTAKGLEQGGTEMAPLVGVLSAMGMIIQLLNKSGLTGRLGTEIIGFADVTLFGFTGGLALVLVLAMITSIIFGLGMPTPAAYILVAFLVADAVTELGTPELTTHMFVFYFAMLSAITPPVAISVAVGSRIADSDFLTSCKQALRLGAPGFVIPFSFVANNTLIQWSAGSPGAYFLDGTPFAFVFVLAGTVGLIVATVGFDGATNLSAPVRLLYLAIGAVAMFGSLAPEPFGYLLQIVAAVTVAGLLLRARYVVGYDIDTAEPTASD